MKLRKPCPEHNRYEKHPLPGATPTMILGSAGMAFADEDWCEGGVFLPDDTELQRRIAEVVDAWAPDLNDYAVERFIVEILDALSVREST